MGLSLVLQFDLMAALDKKLRDNLSYCNSSTGNHFMSEPILPTEVEIFSKSQKSAGGARGKIMDHQGH